MSNEELAKKMGVTVTSGDSSTPVDYTKTLDNIFK
jgi:hypothetical protein